MEHIDQSTPHEQAGRGTAAAGDLARRGEWSKVQSLRLSVGQTLASRARARARAGKPANKLELFTLFLTEEDDPEPFYTRLAESSIEQFQFPLAGRRILDLGAGPGYYSKAMQKAGAIVTPLDLGEETIKEAMSSGLGAVYSDGTCLPFPDATFDGVLCSNMLEHTPMPEQIFSEIERVLRPGGWSWVSWTNWYSPWGGHSISPMHYFGPRLGTRLYTKLFGRPDRNLPYTTLWPTYIGRMLRMVRGREGLRVLDAIPRYYPSQRWILKVPGLREIATWNCLILLERVPERSRTATAGYLDGSGSGGTDHRSVVGP